jgi:4-aminobutyrate aminotransferase-like enzyme/Ser/Thr protein kinase RdoA (MazF antagonist)
MHLLEHSPRLDPEAAASLARRVYGLCATATPLPSERDQNFLLEAKGEKFVLKIANALEERGLLEAQNHVMAHLGTRLTLCPRVIPALTNEQISLIQTARGVSHFVRLLSYLPGIPLAKVPEHSPELLRDLGEKVGLLDRELMSFNDPAVHRNFHWDLAKGLRVVRDYGPLVTNSSIRDLIFRSAGNFEREVSPLLPQLRSSVIHGDMNDFNVLISNTDGQPRTVIGLIDFGDMVHSYTVADLAIAIAYVVLNKPDPLAAAAQVAGGYNHAFQLTAEEIKALWGLVLMRLCMSVCLAAHQQQQNPDNQYLEISQHSITTALPRLMAIDRGVAAETFARICSPDHASLSYSRNPPPSSSLETTLAMRKRLLGPNLSIAYREPIMVVRGSMQYLYDEQGRQYLDAYNNVAHVGHCHPRVVKAGQDQMAALNTNTRYLHDLINRYAERLTNTLPPSLSVCFFVNSGSEANELALRLARAHTNARDLLVLDHAYHGNTTTLIDISPYKHDGPGGQGAPEWVHKVPLPDVYRGLYRSNDPQAAAKYAEHVEETIADLRAAGLNLCGFIAESLPSVAGQLVFPEGYLTRVYQAVREAGGVCIADEVQTGYGRIGSHFWGFESQAVVPDIVVLGKPIGNGHPIGAVITTPEIAASFDNGMEFFSTFGGNTVSCAVGLAVINVVLEENLQAHAMKVGERMLRGLNKLTPRREIIGDVRGSGFFLGVELVRDRRTLEPATSEANLVVNRMRHEGILIGTDGPFHNVLKIRPPLPFSASDADRLVHSLDECLK